jgi:hypothetical protein
MIDAAADAARSAAVILAPDLGSDLPEQVEVALRGRRHTGEHLSQYDLTAIATLGIGAASLIVSIAQFAWTIYSDQRKHAPETSPEWVARQVHAALKDQEGDLTLDAERITEVVAIEIIRSASHSR